MRHGRKAFRKLLVECYTLLVSSSAHTKLEACITLRYVQCGTHIYMYTCMYIENLPLNSIGGLAPFANNYNMGNYENQCRIINIHLSMSVPFTQSPCKI